MTQASPVAQFNNDLTEESVGDVIDVVRVAPRRSRQARVVWGQRVVTVGGDARFACRR